MITGEAGWEVDPDSIRIFNDSLYQVNRFGSPARFGKGMKGVGVSDHWPLLAKIKKTTSGEKTISANEPAEKSTKGEVE